MRKSLLILASFAMSVGAFAQWTKPAPRTTQEMSTEGEVQYLYNYEACGFFAGANDWNTRASVASYGDPIKFELFDGNYYNFCCHPTVRASEFAGSNGGWRFVSCNNYDAMWVDAPNSITNNDYPATEEWMVERQDDGTYKIFNASGMLVDGQSLGVSEFVNGNKGDNRLYLFNENATYTVNVDGEEVEKPRFAGYFYDKWVFISEEEYEYIKPQVEPFLASEKLKNAIANVKAADAAYDLERFNEVYENTSSEIAVMDSMTNIANAVVSLKKALATAETAYSAFCDFTPVKNVYKDNYATAAELAAAEKQIKAIIDAYESTKATFDDPLMLSIGESANIGNWTREFTGEGNTGDPATNTWSVEANDGADGTDMLTPFNQIWTGRGGILSDQKIYQTFNAAPGLYKLTINTRAYNEAGGIDTFKGLKMFFGNDTIDVQSQAPMFQSNDGKSVLWQDGGFSIISVIDESKEIDFGFDIKGANWNWIAFKDATLLYYGNENVVANASTLIRENYTFEKVPTDTDAKEEYIEAYNNAVDAFDNATTKEELMNSIATISSTKATLDANVEAYTKLLENLERWSEAIGEKQGLAGDEWDAFCDFIGFEDEVEGYPTPLPMQIIDGDRSLSTAEINDYIAKVEALYTHAVANSLTPGTDCTDMLTNPSFGDGFTGWTTDAKNVYKSTDGGMNNVEVYQGVVDCYQIIKDVPNGIYSLSCQAFERRGGDANVFLYMNDFQTAVQSIDKDIISADEAINKVNCFNESASYPCDNMIGDGYVPNSMQGASYAFAAGRYNQKVYGLIENGEMKIGLTSNGKKIPDWILWANFKLTYEGANMEALNIILPPFVEELNTFATNNVESLTVPANAEAQAALKAADEATAKGDGTAMLAALSQVNKALKNAKENVEAVNQLTIADLEALEAWATYFDSSTAEALAAYDDYSSKFSNYETNKNLTTEEVLALVDEAKAVTKKLKTPNPAGASDDTPISYTGLIENPDFAANGAQQQATGWTLVKGEGAEGNYQTQNGFDNGISMEFWSPSNGSKTRFNFYQELTELPAGTYTLTADVSNSLNDQTAGPGEGAVFLYAGTNTRMYVSEPVEIQTVGCRDAYKNYSVTINLNEGETLIIGIKNIGELSARWVMVDNFKLEYYGKNSGKEISEEDPTAVGTIATANEAPAAIYSISGTRTETLKKGINIVRMADGSVKKVLVK